MRFQSYILILISFIYSASSFGNTKECKEYAIQAQKDRRLYSDLCVPDASLNSKLFPEFDELIEFREENNKELTDKDYDMPEIEWCNFSSAQRINELQKKRTHEINLCKNDFKKLYGNISKTVPGLIPAHYQILRRKEVPTIQHDFNNDGIKDSIFVIVKAADSTEGRLLIALSQPEGLFKSIPIAAYHVGNNDKESGSPYTIFALQKPSRFILTTQSLDNNNWDSKEEWVFRYEHNDFNLLSYSSGYTSISYDASTKSTDESTVYQFDKKISYKSKDERCDYYYPKEPHYRCNSKEGVFTPGFLIKIGNFTDLESLLKESSMK